MISTLRTLFKMTRPLNIVIAVITLVASYMLLNYYRGLLIMPLQALGFAAAIAFANIENDVRDLESDRLNRPERPLVTGKITVKTARRAWKAIALLMLFCGFLDTVIQGIIFFHLVGDIDHALVFGWVGLYILTFPLWFFALLGALLLAYNNKLKHIPLIKNMTVAFLCTTPLLFATQYFYNYSDSLNPEAHIWAVIPAIPFAFLLTLAREIYKDLEDETGDLKAGIMTFPIVAGAQKARRLANIIILFTWISLPLPVFCLDKVFDYNYPPLFLIITAITLTPCFAIAIWSAHHKNYRRAQSVTKIAMFLGLLALLICSMI